MLFPASKNVIFIKFLLRLNFSTISSGLQDFYRVKLDVIGFGQIFGIGKYHIVIPCTWFPKVRTLPSYWPLQTAVMQRWICRGRWHQNGEEGVEIASGCGRLHRVGVGPQEEPSLDDHGQWEKGPFTISHTQHFWFFEAISSLSLSHSSYLSRVGEDIFEKYLRYRYRYMRVCVFQIHLDTDTINKSWLKMYLR